MKTFLIFFAGAIIGMLSLTYTQKKSEAKEAVKELKYKFVVTQKNGQSDSVTAFYKCCNSTWLYNYGNDKSVLTDSIKSIKKIEP